MRIIVSFKASNAKFIGAEAADGKLSANMSRDFPFLLEELGNNKVRLRALPNQARYVEAAGGGGQGLFARLETPDGNCTFSLVQVTAKEVALLSPNGVNYVTCEDNGEITARATVRGPRETFAMTKFIAKEKKSSKATDDSSQDGIQALLWNDMTHAQVVDTALRLMFKNHLDKPPVRLLSVLTARKPFKDAMLKGLKDADYELQYTGIAWKYHFYHPGSGQNYMGFGETAKSMGVRYFDLALNAGNDIYRKLQRGQQPTDQELFGCGYNLGVALHYITDLTQPMHASNFANVFGDDFPWPKANEFRHKGLEEMTEDIVVKQNYLGNAPDIAYWQFTPEPYANAGDILHEAAVIANATFLRTVKSLMPEPGAAWKEADVKRILDETIKTVGLHSVA
ncbi:MAG TPA: hypothetical protein VHS96_12505, partial [Bacteroidia bacterium]|nr:hypothetical protein [Bacteroidia bacterium]